MMQQVLHIKRAQAHQTLRRLFSCGMVIFFKSSFVGLDDEGCFPTRAVQAASKLSGHHLHYQSYPESQHVSEQHRLRADVHGQIHHNFLCGNQVICCKIRVQKSLAVAQILNIYLSENSNTDILAAGFIYESV